MSHESHTSEHPLSFGKYFLGFTFAIVLTLISFGLVAFGVSKNVAVMGLIAAAIVQMLVHLHYFLHLDRSKEMRWNFIAIVFTAIILFIFVAGTVWVMITLHSRMM